MCAWPARGQEGRRPGEAGGEWEREAAERGRRKEERGEFRGPPHSCCRRRSCPGRIAKTATNKQLTLGSCAPPGMDVQFLLLGHFVWCLLVFPAPVPPEAGAAPERCGPGTWRDERNSMGGGRGLSEEDGTGVQMTPGNS